MVLNQSSLFTTHKSYVGLILIIKFITLICFWVNHNNSLLHKNFLYRKNWPPRLKNIQEGSWLVVQFLSKINKLKAMNKGQVSEEIVVLLWWEEGLYQLKCIIYIYIYIYIYSKLFSLSTVSTCKRRARYIWTPKEINIVQFISWCILSSTSPHNGASRRCNLCLKEKLLIIFQHELSSLNKNNELVSSCHHRNKALLRNNWWTKHWNLPPRLLWKFVK